MSENEVTAADRHETDTKTEKTQAVRRTTNPA